MSQARQEPLPNINMGLYQRMHKWWHILFMHTIDTSLSELLDYVKEEHRNEGCENIHVSS
jgi:hypothetical protein